MNLLQLRKVDMNAKLILGLILVGSAATFIIQNIAVMELRFLFWTVSISSALIIVLILTIGIFLGLLLNSSFSKRKGNTPSSK